MVYSAIFAIANIFAVSRGFAVPKIHFRRHVVTRASCHESNDVPRVSRRQLMSRAAALAVLGAGSSRADALQSSMSWKAASALEKCAAADNLYTIEFTAYLARFLLTFDSATRSWWVAQSPASADFLYDNFVASLADGLGRTICERSPEVDYERHSVSARKVCVALVKRFGDSPGVNGDVNVQLALLFTLLSPSDRPVDLIEGLLTGSQPTTDLKANYRDASSTHSTEWWRDPGAVYPFSSDGVKKSEVSGTIMNSAQVANEAVVVRRDLERFALARRMGFESTEVAATTATAAAAPAAAPQVEGTTALLTRVAPLGVGTYAAFGGAGAVGCCATHALVTPLDVVKTRKQTAPASFGALSVAAGLRKIYKEEGGARGWFTGLGPTACGYAWYGATVYPGYEFFKRTLLEAAATSASLKTSAEAGGASATAASMAMQMNSGSTAAKSAAAAVAASSSDVLPESVKVPLVLLAGAMATCIACLGVCPAEAVRIRVVARGDASAGRSSSESNGGMYVLQSMVEESGVGVLWQGLPPLLVRQVIFGMVKFLVFDYFPPAVYSALPALASARDSGGTEGSSVALGVSLASGAVAGFVSSAVSQPGDAILTRMSQDARGLSVADAAKSLWRGDATVTLMAASSSLGSANGRARSNSDSSSSSSSIGTRDSNNASGSDGSGGLAPFFAGLGPRSVWAACVIAGQFGLYDLFKLALHVTPADLQQTREAADVLATAGLRNLLIGEFATDGLE